MQRALRRYQDPNLAAGSPREVEIAAFALCIKGLREAVGPVQRIRALHRNHALWSAILKDVGMVANALPDELKRQIAGLAAWAMSYSIRAMAEDMPLEPLIAVNQNMAEGLRAQATAVPPTAMPPGRSHALSA